MAVVVGVASTTVNQKGSDPPTCFGLPGYGSIQNSWSNCNFVARAVVLDNYRAYVGIDGSITDTVVENNYPVIMVANKTSWSWSYSGGNIVVPSGAATIATADIVVTGTTPENKGPFTWNIDCQAVSRGTNCGSSYESYLTSRGYRYVGQLQELGGSTQDEDGHIWVSGTGTYDIDDPIYPEPVEIVIPGFLEFLDYYPWAIRKSGRWMSCDRDGGHLKSRSGSSWSDVKNVDVGTGEDHGFSYDDEEWTQSPRTGDLT